MRPINVQLTVKVVLQRVIIQFNMVVCNPLKPPVSDGPWVQCVFGPRTEQMLFSLYAFHWSHRFTCLLLLLFYLVLTQWLRIMLLYNSIIMRNLLSLYSPQVTHCLNPLCLRNFQRTSVTPGKKRLIVN